MKMKISMTIDREVVEKLQELADRDDRSLSSYINRVLKAAVAEELPKKEG